MIALKKEKRKRKKTAFNNKFSLKCQTEMIRWCNEFLPLWLIIIIICHCGKCHFCACPLTGWLFSHPSAVLMGFILIETWLKLMTLRRFFIRKPSLFRPEMILKFDMTLIHQNVSIFNQYILSTRCHFLTMTQVKISFNYIASVQISVFIFLVFGFWCSVLQKQAKTITSLFFMKSIFN